MKTGGFKLGHLIHTFQHRHRVRIFLSFIIGSLWYKCLSLCPRCTSRRAQIPPVRSPPFLLKSFTKLNCGETQRPKRGKGGLLKTVTMMLMKTVTCVLFQTLPQKQNKSPRHGATESPSVDGLFSQLIVTSEIPARCI